MPLQIQTPSGPVKLPHGKVWPPKPKPLPKIVKAL
jgi:hypothetical protein